MNSQMDRAKKVFYHSNLLFSIRIIIALLGTTVVPALLGDIHAIMPLTLGVMAAATADIDASPKQRLINLAIILSCFALASFSIELLFPYPWLFLIGLVLSGFFFTIIGAFGQIFSVISFATLLMATYTMLGIGLYDKPFVLSSLLLLGALWYGIIAWIESIVQPIRTTHEYLHHSFLSLKNFLYAKSQMFDPDETDGFRVQTKELATINEILVQSLNQSKHSLFNRLRGDQGHKRVRILLNYYFVAQDIHERANSTHISYQTLSHQLKNSDILFRLARLMSLQASACEKIAHSIKYRATYVYNPLFERHFKMLEDAIDRADLHRSLKFSLLNIMQNLKGIDQQFRQINQANYISEDSLNNNLVEDEVSSFKDAYQRIKNNLTLKSSLFRHSLRISLVFAIGYLLVQTTQLEHGYWIIMTSLFVCQPNYATTKNRLFLRVAGTISGIFLGVFFVYLFTTLATQLFAIIVSAWLFFMFRKSRYAFATAFITLLAFFSFSLTGENSWEVALYRIIATLIGSGIAWLAVSFLWPDWHYRTLPNLVKTTNKDNGHYLIVTHRQYQKGRIDNAEYRLARREAHENSADLSSLISIMSNEPKVNHALIDTAFKFLTLNHTLISYISTLGAHRNTNISLDIEHLFNDVTLYIDNTLQQGELDESTHNSHRSTLQNLLDNFDQQAGSPIDFQVVSQLLLMLEILPEIIKLTNNVQALA